MNYWYVWPIGIALWLAVGWAFFAYFEGTALRHDARKDQITLSMFVYTVGSKFPLSIAIGGFLCGGFWFGLFVHFFWHWCPAGAAMIGALLRGLT